MLAGILIKTGWDIIDRAYILKAHRGPRWDLALMLLVLTMTVFVDLIQAVAAGVVLASLAFVKQIADEQLKSLRDIADDKLSTNFSEEETKLIADSSNSINVFDFGGPLSFGAAADFGYQIREKSKGPVSDGLRLFEGTFLRCVGSTRSTNYCRRRKGLQQTGLYLRDD